MNAVQDKIDKVLARYPYMRPVSGKEHLVVSKITIESPRHLSDNEEACICVYARTTSWLEAEKSLRRKVYEEPLGVSVWDLNQPPQDVFDAMEGWDKEEYRSRGFTVEFDED